MRHLLAPLVLSLFSAAALAHGGHGASGAHWHASDLFGPVVLAVAAGTYWWSRRK